MKILILSVLLLIFFNAHAQDYLSNYNFEEVPCVYDESVMINKPIDFEVYQTVDGRVNSPHIENCISVNQGKLLLNELDRQLPIFVRYVAIDKLDLYPDVLYNIYHQVALDGLITGIDCDGCSRLLVNTSRPSADQSTIVVTENEILFNEDDPFSFERFICFPTQKGEGQELYDLYFELFIDPSYEENSINFPYFELFEFYDYETINSDKLEVNVLPNSDNIYNVHITDGWISTFFLHHKDGTQTADNFSHIDIVPTTNLTSQSVFKIEFGEMESIYFQDFTGLRGGLVSESGPERHQLQIGLSSSLCLYLIEVVNSGGNVFSFRQGSSINMYGKTACMMMQDSSTLEVDSDVLLHYGNEGTGMLALFDQSNTIIKEGAELFFDGRLVLSGKEDDQGSIYVERRAVLTFSARSIIDNSRDPNKKVDVYLRGGEINMKDLPLEEQSKINVIKEGISPEKVVLFPNPSPSFVNLSSPAKMKAEFINGRGELMDSYILEKGNNSLDVSRYADGLYIVNFIESSNFEPISFLKL